MNISKNPVIVYVWSGTRSLHLINNMDFPLYRFKRKASVQLSTFGCVISAFNQLYLHRNIQLCKTGDNVLADITHLLLTNCSSSWDSTETKCAC